MRKVLQWLKGVFWQDIEEACVFPDGWVCAGRLLSYRGENVIGFFFLIQLPLFARGEWHDFYRNRICFGYRVPRLGVFKAYGELRWCFYLNPYGEPEEERRWR